MKQIIFFVSIFFVSVAMLYPQLPLVKISDIDKKIQQAPTKIRRHYATIDSLIDLGQKRWVNETWTDNEVKRYASLLYNVYEHDPVLRYLHEYDPELIKRYENKGWLIDDRTIFREVDKRFSRHEAYLIKMPYWLAIKVDSVITQPLEELPVFTQRRVFGTITKIWKGLQFQAGQKIECYYLTAWGNTKINASQEWILVLDPVMDFEKKKHKTLAIGGLNLLDMSAFQIKENFVNDQRNFFGLGTLVQFKSFDEFLTNEITKIKSWKWSADK